MSVNLVPQGLFPEREYFGNSGAQLGCGVQGVCGELVVRVLAFAAVILASLAAAFAGDYTQEMFNKALNDRSTSPPYVLINVPKYGKEDICVPAPFLLGAISKDRELASDPEGEKNEIKVAEANFGKVFSFSSSKALANVKPRYGQD
ncbi:MAG: hypothetical protein E6Q76_00210, partial [Rhizobium sp.]